MKYLLLTTHRFGPGYEVKEFATADELTAHIYAHGAKDAIVARRLEAQMRVIEWEPDEPAEESF